MASVKERLIKEIQGIDDDRVLKSIQNFIHSVKDASSYKQVNTEQRAAFEEGRNEYKKGNLHSTDDLYNDMTTLTIDIPEKETEAILAIFEKHGVIVQKSSLDRLDKLNADDYRKHFKHQANTGRGFIKNHL